MVICCSKRTDRYYQAVREPTYRQTNRKTGPISPLPLIREVKMQLDVDNAMTVRGGTRHGRADDQTEN